MQLDPIKNKIVFHKKSEPAIKCFEASRKSMYASLYQHEIVRLYEDAFAHLISNIICNIDNYRSIDIHPFLKNCSKVASSEGDKKQAVLRKIEEYLSLTESYLWLMMREIANKQVGEYQIAECIIERKTKELKSLNFPRRQINRATDDNFHLKEDAGSLVIIDSTAG